MDPQSNNQKDENIGTVQLNPNSLNSSCSFSSTLDDAKNSFLKSPLIRFKLRYELS
jgi:hypothetical protein